MWILWKSTLEILACTLSRTLIINIRKKYKSSPTGVYIYIYIYIVIHRQTVSLYHNEHQTARPTSVPRWLRNYKVLCSNSSSVRMFTFLYLTGYQSAQFVRRALHYASGCRKLLRQSAQPTWASMYIVIHRQTVSLDHNSSVWIDT